MARFDFDDDEYEDIVRLGRGRRPYRVTRGEHGEFLGIKEPVERWEEGQDEE
ncbi:MAG: hypothetical protein AAB360_01980 [Patescibacteria group bacterium]